MEPIAQLAAVLVAPDPKGAAEHALTYLMGVHGAAQGAVFALREPALIPYVTREIDARRVDEILGSWSSLEGALRGGSLVRHDDLILYPLQEDGEMLGLLVLGGHVGTIREDLLRTFGLAMAKAIQATVPGVAVQAGRPVGLARENLLLNLARHEWNIARVARMMGVTRRTIYLRLRRYGIDRVRIPKMKVREAVT